MHQQAADGWWGEPAWVRASPGDWDQLAASTPLADLQAFAKATAAHSSPLGADWADPVRATLEHRRRTGLPSQWVRGRFWAWLVGKSA